MPTYMGICYYSVFYVYLWPNFKDVLRTKANACYYLPIRFEQAPPLRGLLLLMELFMPILLQK